MKISNETLKKHPVYDSSLCPRCTVASSDDNLGHPLNQTISNHHCAWYNSFNEGFIKSKRS